MATTEYTHFDFSELGGREMGGGLPKRRKPLILPLKGRAAVCQAYVKNWRYKL